MTELQNCWQSMM